MRTSYSALSTYKTCPLKYKYQEIDKIRAPKSKEAVFGTAVHEALNFMFKKSPLYPTLDEVVNFFAGSWESRKAKIDWQDNEAGSYFDSGVKIIKNFYAKNQPWNFNVVDLESRFSVELPATASAESHVLAGIIDRIDKIDEDNFEIIDYKTARKMPSQTALDNDLQMSIYHLGLLERWPHLKTRNVKLSLYFLQHNEKISTERSPESLEKTRASVISSIKEIEGRVLSGDFPAMPGPLCDWCGYKKMCPMWRHLYKKDELSEEEIKIAVDEYLNLKQEAETKTARLKFLQGMIHEYLDKNDLGRAFGDGGFVTRTLKRAPIFDAEKLRPILEEAGLWSAVLKVDDRKLIKAVAALSPALREQAMNEAVTGEKETRMLLATRRKSVVDAGGIDR